MIVPDLIQLALQVKNMLQAKIRYGVTSMISWLKPDQARLRRTRTMPSLAVRTARSHFLKSNRTRRSFINNLITFYGKQVHNSISYLRGPQITLKNLIFFKQFFVIYRYKKWCLWASLRDLDIILKNYKIPIRVVSMSCFL